MRRTMIRLISVVVVGSVLTLAVVSTSRARELQCGDEIFASVTLRKNLTGCSGSGLVIREVDVTIRLNGFKITGDGIDTPGVIEAAIDNSEGHDLVKIDGRRVGSSRRGTLSGFDAGVFIGANGALNTVTRLRATNNVAGVVIEGFSNKVTKVRSTGNARQGILIDGGDSNFIIKNRSDENGTDGIFAKRHDTTLDVPMANNITDNSASLNQESGIDVDNGLTNLIERNITSGNEDDGIDFDGGNNTVRLNESTGNGESGIDINNGSNDIVTDNNVSENTDHGIDLSGGGGGTFERNQALGNDENGIKVFESDNNTFDGNTANENQTHGIRIVDDASDGNDILNNVTNDNGTPASGDDFGLGIDAEADSTVAGGGNTAVGNDDPRECVPSFLCA